MKFDELEEQFYFWKFFKLEPRKINVFETLPTVFFCESNLQPVSDCERHYRAGYGSIQFSHNQAEVVLARCLCIPKFRETQPRFYEQ